MQDWIPIEVLPKMEFTEEDVKVLAFLIDKNNNETQKILIFDFWTRTFEEESTNSPPIDYTEYVTHWQPLPKNPQ
jgi:hypothetical protein